MKQKTVAGYVGHRLRIKDKYKKGGITGWLDYEILEFMLSYSIPRRDTKLLAKELIKKFKTINGVLDADTKDLQSVNGISEHTSTFIKFLKDVILLCYAEKLYDKDLISSPQKVYDYLIASMKSLPDEEFKVLFLNSRNLLINIETIQRGTVDKAFIYPRKVIERAIYNHAVGIIIAHNHPGESIEPSEDDIKVTKALNEALKTIDVLLLDHVIIGGTNYFSFRQSKLI